MEHYNGLGYVRPLLNNVGGVVKKMVKYRYCRKTLKDDRFDFCDIGYRRNNQLSRPKQRVGIPIMEQDFTFHKNNYLVQKYGILC